MGEIAAGLGRHAGSAARAETGAVPQWLRLLVTGLVLWSGALVLAAGTDNIRLLPPVILLGSFLAPVTFVVWAFERAFAGDLDLSKVARGFLIGGGLGVLSAAQLEFYLVERSPLHIAGLALLAEFLKLIVLLSLASRIAPRTPTTVQGGTREPATLAAPRRRLSIGLVLGAAVGFGFAGFESAGMAVTSLFTAGGLTLEGLIETELLPGILIPVGNGMWTAILGGIVFLSLGRGRWQATGRTTLALLGVTVLHILWDSTDHFAVAFTSALTGASWPSGVWKLGHLDATGEQVHLYAALNWMGLVSVGLAGVLWLTSLARREQLRGTTRATQLWLPSLHQPRPAAALDREDDTYEDRDAPGEEGLRSDRTVQHQESEPAR